jgi:hypothetical protein
MTTFQLQIVSIKSLALKHNNIQINFLLKIIKQVNSTRIILRV